MTAIGNWQGVGIDFIEDFNSLTQEVESGRSPRHDFLVVDNREQQIDWSWLEAYLNCLPYRIIVIGGGNHVPENLGNKVVSVKWDELREYLDSPDRLLAFLWEKWVQSHWGDFTLYVRHMEDQRAQVSAAEKFICQECDPSIPNALVYDHKPRSDRTCLYSMAAFHECFTRGEPIEKLLISEERWILWSLKEAAAITVAVLDERVFMERNRAAREAVGKYECPENKTVEGAWKKRRVYLLDHKQAIKQFDSFLEGGEKYDFFIIHQGIIDEVKKRNEGRFDEGWRRIKGCSRWIVIDTGRGEPGQARAERLRWVEYSVLSDRLINNAAEKYGLAQLLFALRAKSQG